MTRVELGDGSSATIEVGPATSVAVLPSIPAALDFQSVETAMRVSTVAVPGLEFTGAPLDVAGLGAGSQQGQVIGGSIRYVQAAPAATWSFQHPLGRPPQVTVYVADGGLLEQVDTDVSATSTTVVVSWPYPVAGELIVQ